MDCVEVCPVDCFHEGENMLVIHPDEWCHAAYRKVGRLAPGMQADVVLISYKRVGLFPLHNPTALVVMYATPADVDTVLVAGKVLKRGGKLQGVDYAALMREAEASADYLYSQSKMASRPASYTLQA
jgi:cytosine/adenosine deaminase-related metal-dependent hydrolase